MKLTLLALFLAAPCSLALAATQSAPLDSTSSSWSFETGMVHLSPLSPMPVRAPVIISAESALTHMVKPRFPTEMRMSRQPGFVRLEVVVADDGRVIEASVLESSRDPFAREALRAVGQWQFVPAENPQPDGRRLVRVPIEFRIFRRVR